MKVECKVIQTLKAYPALIKSSGACITIDITNRQLRMSGQWVPLDFALTSSISQA